MYSYTNQFWITYHIARKLRGKDFAENVRHLMRKSQSNCRKVSATHELEWETISGDWDRRIQKVFIPKRMSYEDIVAFREEYTIRPRYSAYDCTGEAFTMFMDFFRTDKGTWVYHTIGYDV